MKTLKNPISSHSTNGTETKSFTEKVYAIVKKIPHGETLSYQQVADFAGSPGASRAVGSILRKNTDKTIPCHRVIRSNGQLGKYNGLQCLTKKEILERERGL